MSFELIEKFSSDNNSQENLGQPDIKSTKIERGAGTETRNQQEREMSLEERIQTIIAFVNSDFEEKFPFGILNVGSETREEKERIEQLSIEFFKRDEKDTMGWFENKSDSEIKELLGEDTIVFAQETISFYLQEMKKIIESEETREDAQRLIEKEMLPGRFDEFLMVPQEISRYFSGVLRSPGFLRDNPNNFIEKELIIFKERISEIEKELFPEKKEKEPIQIQEFEMFDSSEVKGEEFVKQALQFVPQELLGKNIETIIYEDREVPIPEAYGIEGNASAHYDATRKRVAFFKSDKSKTQFLQDIPNVMSHEAGHALDPRLISQEKLSLLEEIQMITEWERVRAMSIPFSDYVKKINNKDKIIENLKKSKEDFAETVMMFLVNPKYLEHISLLKFEFCEKWFAKKQFPEENFTKIKIFYIV